MQGDDVALVQDRLRALGYTPARTGTYDAATERAVRAFQKSNRLDVDGQAGRHTLGALGLSFDPSAPSRPVTAPTATPQTPPARVNVPTATPQSPAARVALPPLRAPQTPVTVPPFTAPSARITVPPISTPRLPPTPAFAPTPRVAVPTPAVPDVALGPVSERRALATRLVTTRGANTTQADADAVIGELSKMPISDLRDLQRAGLSVIACRESVVDAVPSLANQQPRGHAPGRGWQDVPGAYIPEQKAVVVATTAASDGTRIVPPFNVKHGSASLVEHEVGHALDAARRYPSKSDPAFQAAYQADLASGQLLAYYTQGGEAGPSEAYAESLALTLAGDPRGDGARRFPRMMEYWRTHYREASS